MKGKRSSPPPGALTQQTHTQSAKYGSQTPDRIERPKADALPSPSSQLARQGGQSNGDPPKFQVLLVEDNLVNRRDPPSISQPIRTDPRLEKVLGKQLQKAGCTVHVANHGQEALDFIERSNLWKHTPGGELIDVVLMDLEMPIMDGLTCARKIRELQAQGTLIRHVPIIAVTANARMEQIETSMAAGMVRYLSVSDKKKYSASMTDLMRY